MPPGGNLKFQPHERVRQSADYRRIKAEGAVIRGDLLLLRYLENGLSHARFGMIVSKRQGNAVRRNRIKRRLREIFRMNKEKFPSGYDVVVIPLVGAASLPCSELGDKLLRLVARLGQKK